MNATASNHHITLAIDRRCHEQPDNPCIHWHGQTLSYDQVRRRTNRLGRLLRTTDPAGTVGVCTARGEQTLIAVLGVLKADATLVPVDSGHPPERLEFIRRQADIRRWVVSAERLPELCAKLALNAADMVVLEPGGIAAVPASEPAERAEADLHPVGGLDATAYIIYTSGSTGQPKGVCIPHRALYRSIVDGVPAIRMIGADRCAQLATLSFDAAVWEHLAPLYCGAMLFSVPPELLTTPQGFIDFIAAHCISWTYLPPALFAQWLACCDSASERDRFSMALSSLRCILFAGETLPPALVRAWQAFMGTRVTLMNFYGPTETTVLVCGHVIDYLLSEDCTAVPIGRPFGDNRIYLLDADLHPCRPGEIGTLYIGGPQVAQGYLGPAELTERAFIPDPSEPGGRLYNSRDLAWMNPDGELIFAGRADHQVKVRGKRIELEEIEKRLLAQPAVTGAVAFVYEEDDGVKRLVAVVAGTADEPASLRAYLAATLPDYMVPHELVLTAALPLNSNGKLDRQVVREHYAAQRAQQGRARAAAAAVEADPIARLWLEVLGRAPAADSDHFFDLGGDSLLLFRALLLAGQCGYVVLDQAALLADNTLAGWRRQLQYRPATVIPMTPPPPLLYPLAPMQREMFLLTEHDPGCNLYQIQFAFTVAPLDSAILEQAFRAVIRHHPILRTVFQAGPDGLQNRQLEPAVAANFTLGRVWLAGLQHPTQVLNDWLAEEHRQPFAIDTFPLVRANHVHVAGQQYVVITFFHPLLDGWSFSHWVLQVCRAYTALAAGQPLELLPLRSHFADYVQWLASLRNSLAYEREQAYWRAELQQPLPLITLEPDQPVVTGLTRRAFYIESEVELSDRLQALARRHRVTLHRLLLTAYFMLFQQLTGRCELLIGNTVAGRPLDLADADQILGCFINILPIRIADAAQSFEILLAAVAAKVEAALAHNRWPNELHVQNLLAEEKRTGLCWRVIFALDNFPEAFDGGLLRWPPYSWNAIEPFDIALSIIHLHGRLYYYWNYRSDRYTETMLRELSERYLTILRVLA